MRLRGATDGEIEISNSEFINKLLSNLKKTSTSEKGRLPEGFTGTLRPYQVQGVAYLDAMAGDKMGACLADDMGLGKTVQVICHIGSFLEKEGGRVLLVVPVSLVGNWQKEFKHFLPSVELRLLTGQSKRAKMIDVASPGVYITTYSLLSKLDNVKSSVWDIAVIDEAQAIKNSTSALSRAVRALKAKERIALTGTPIENRIGDLWSLFDYLNPGLLGSRKEFVTYSKWLKESGSYAPLRKVISPFILRRMKSDKSIISDLPEKIEEKVYPVLTPLQVELYKSCVEELGENLEVLDGIERHGLVLSTLMKLKQICNHPSQYSGEDTASYETDQSGKFQLLAEIASSIADRHERVLVFTQFREIIPALDALLSSVFGQRGLVLHGGVGAKERTALVERFNGSHYCPYMILSLKAGGVGLNLTAANHVIHFDRWWNPAVENQATDRAYRIGQKKNVVVHTFITKGTIEENIDILLEEKRELSASLLSSAGESWLTELSNKEIISLCTLEGGLE